MHAPACPLSQDTHRNEPHPTHRISKETGGSSRSDCDCCLQRPEYCQKTCCLPEPCSLFTGVVWRGIKWKTASRHSRCLSNVVPEPNGPPLFGLSVIVPWAFDTLDDLAHREPKRLIIAQVEIYAHHLFIQAIHFRFVKTTIDIFREDIPLCARHFVLRKFV